MARGDFDWKPIFMIVMFAVLGLYLFGKFLVKDTAGAWSFQAPASCDASGGPKGCIDQVTLMVMKIVIVGGAVLLGLVLATKFGSPLNRRDAFTLILIGVGVYFLWDYILRPILGGSTIDTIIWKTGQKLGLFP